MTIKLELTNFGKFGEYSIEFPSKGRLLLQGMSGSGKTTLVKAICFALKGGVASRLVSRGKRPTTCKVRLVAGDFDIKRSGGKNKVVLLYQGNEYKGETAQTLIDRVYPSETSFYLDQHHKYNLFRMTPLTLFKELQKLTGYNAKYTTDLTDYIKRLKTQSKDTQTKLDAINIILGVNMPPVETGDELHAEQDRLLELRNSYKEMMRRQDRSSTAISERKILQSQLQAITDDDPTPYQTELRVICDDLDYLTLLEKYNARERRTTLKRKLKQTPSVDIETLSRHHSEYLDRLKLQKKLDSLRPEQSAETLREMSEHISTLKLSMERYECPSCSETLCINQGVMTICTITDDVEEVRERIRVMEQELAEHQTNNRKRVRLMDKLETLHSTDVTAELETGRKTYDTRIRLKQELEQLPRIDSSELVGFIPRDTTPHRDDLLRRKRELEVGLDIARRNQRDRNNIMEKLDSLPPVEQYDIPENIHELYSCTVEQLQVIKDKISRLPLHQHVAERVTLQEELSHTAKECETASQLLNIVKKAERDSLFGFINQINHEMEAYIEKVYNIPPACNFRVGEKRIDVDINHDGYDISLDDLSGGEQDRLSLILTCALSNITGSPFIILDESISSLDMETSELVFEAMEQLKEDKLVIYIAHQMVEGHYEDVVTLTQ